MKLEYVPPMSDSHTQTENPFPTKHTIKNPNFFALDKNSNDYIANHNKKYHTFLIKCDFKLILTMIFQNLFILEQIFLILLTSLN